MKVTINSRRVVLAAAPHAGRQLLGEWRLPEEMLCGQVNAPVIFSVTGCCGASAVQTPRDVCWRFHQCRLRVFFTLVNSTIPTSPVPLANCSCLPSQGCKSASENGHILPQPPVFPPDPPGISRSFKLSFVVPGYPVCSVNLPSIVLTWSCVTCLSWLGISTAGPRPLPARSRVPGAVSHGGAGQPGWPFSLLRAGCGRLALTACRSAQRTERLVWVHNVGFGATIPPFL